MGENRLKLANIGLENLTLAVRETSVSQQSCMSKLGTPLNTSIR